jgi:hypothetical protein
MPTSIRRLAVRAAPLFAGLLALTAVPLAQGADAQAKPLTAAQRADRAKGLALGQETAQRVSETQLKIADRVLTSDAACEFNQSVSVAPIDGRPGHFRLSFKKVNYTMIPEETSSGAIRLEDKKSGVVWLQIPSKSMLMNSKLGQRMVDGCQHAEQRAATRAVEAAGSKP